MRAALALAGRTLLRSSVGLVATLAIVLGQAVLLAGMALALRRGDPALEAKLGPAASQDWDGLLSSAAQITTAGGMLGVSVVLTWIVAREFVDGTVDGLFALPVARGTIAIAKVLVMVAWGAALSLALVASIAVLGLLLGYGPPDAGVLAGLARQLLLGVLLVPTAMPVAVLATWRRSILAGTAGGIALVVLAQVGVLAGAGRWLPPCIPALWALGAEGVGAGSLLLVPVWAAAWAGLLHHQWRRLQQDR